MIEFRSRAIDRYLARNSEYGTDYAERLAVPRHAQTVVIPALGEDPGLLTTLRSIPGPHTLAIIVLNARPTDPPAVHAANRRCRQQLIDEYGTGIDLASDLIAHATPFGSLLVIDRDRPERLLPEREGVGLARKIGCDLALALWLTGSVTSPWISTTDADATVPHSYFDETGIDDDIAVLLPFVHIAESAEIAPAIALYDAHLRYWVCGLGTAGSPWAYHAIGSTIRVHAAAYAAVAGFPRRAAAEDFHLLAKLAKIGTIRLAPGAPVRILGRRSTRVPFGTGRAMIDICDRLSAGDPGLLFDHPEAFTQLGVLLQALQQLTQHTAHTSLDLPPAMHAAFESLGGIAAITKLASEVRAVRQRERQFATWLDSFRTRKLIHTLRTHGYPQVPFEAAATATFLPKPNTFAPSELSSRLAELELEQNRRGVRRGLAR